MARELELDEDGVPQDEMDLAKALSALQAADPEFVEHAADCEECRATLEDAKAELVDVFATDEE